MDTLSDELRENYRKRLSAKGHEWVIALAFIVGMVGSILLYVTITGRSNAGVPGQIGVIVIGVVAAYLANRAWVARRRAMISQWPDDLLANNYQEYQQSRRTHRIWAAIATAVVVLLLAMLMLNEPADTALFFSPARCAVVQSDTHTDIFVVNGGPDAGYTIAARIRNDGKLGKVRVDVVLSTSEGQFERTQELELAEDENRSLSYGFSEPTINATNVQGSVTCSPAS